MPQLPTTPALNLPSVAPAQPRALHAAPAWRACRPALAVLWATLALAACGGGDDEPPVAAAPAPVGSTPAPAPAPTPAPTPSPAPAPTPAPTPAPAPSATASTSGSLTPSDTTLTAVFTPQAASDGSTPAFATTVYGTSGIGVEQWSFGQAVALPDSSGNTAGVAYRLLVATVTNDALALQHIEARYVSGAVRMHSRRCSAPCAGATLTRQASGTGFTLALAGSTFRHDAIGTTLAGAPTADVAFSGSLTADWPGAYLFLNQLPVGTSGNLTVDGVAVTPRYATTAYNTRQPNPAAFPGITLGLNHAATVFTVNIPGSVQAQSLTYRPSAAALYSGAVPAGSLVQTATSHTLSFNQLALALTGSGAPQVVFNGSITTGRSSGTVSWSGGSFTALSETGVSASNRDIVYTFTGFVAGAAIQPQLTVKLRGGALYEMNVLSGSSDLRCGPTLTAGQTTCRGTVTASADGRTLDVSGVVLSEFLSPGTTATLNGQLVSAGN